MTDVTPSAEEEIRAQITALDAKPYGVGETQASRAEAKEKLYRQLHPSEGEPAPPASSGEPTRPEARASLDAEADQGEAPQPVHPVLADELRDPPALHTDSGLEWSDDARAAVRQHADRQGLPRWMIAQAEAVLARCTHDPTPWTPESALAELTRRHGPGTADVMLTRTGRAAWALLEELMPEQAAIIEGKGFKWRPDVVELLHEFGTRLYSSETPQGLARIRREWR